MKLKKRNSEPGTIDLLRREMDRFFDDLVPFSWLGGETGTVMDSWMPRTDISEDEKEYVIRMDIPGMDKSDIKVNIQDGRITVTGERKKESTDEKKDVIRSERSYGSFYRSFSLPDTVLEEKIEASFRDGVLKLVVPKAEEMKPKSIKVS